MDKIRGVFDVELTVEEVTLINELIERDKPKALTQSEWEASTGTIYTDYKCSVCSHKVSNGDTFCDKCGQRLDWENIEL